MNYTSLTGNKEKWNRIMRVYVKRKISDTKNVEDKKEAAIKSLSYEVAVVESSIRLGDHEQTVYVLDGNSTDRYLIFPIAKNHPGREYKIINSSSHAWEFFSESDTDEIPLEIGRGKMMMIISDGIGKWWTS